MLRAARDKPEVRVVADEVLTPTPTAAVARAIGGLVEADETGLFHLTAEGECSWYDFARVIFDQLKLATPLIPVSGNEFPSTVRRPRYSVLENANLKRTGQPLMPHWRDALRDFLQSSAVQTMDG
jgi:dTDP-4-dehydrorhamnose reductase